VKDCDNERLAVKTAKNHAFVSLDQDLRHAWRIIRSSVMFSNIYTSVRPTTSMVTSEEELEGSALARHVNYLYHIHNHSIVVDLRAHYVVCISDPGCKPKMPDR
jgi:hypothetical protein